MKTFLSDEFMKCASNEEYNYKMNTSNSDCDPNSSSGANCDSGYLTNYHQESHSFSTSSSGHSSEDLYPQKPIDPEVSNLYFCENAVFDEPNLEGPPILFEDISIDLNNIIRNDFVVPLCPKYPLESENMDNSNNEVLHFDKLKRSTEKKTPLKNESPKIILNTSDSETSFSSQTNDFPFDHLRISADELANTTISSVCSSTSSIVDSVKKQSNNALVNITPNKPIINKHEVSPDLFSEEEDAEEEILPLTNITISLEAISQTQRPVVQNEQMLRNDRKLLRRVQEAVSGVPPPPSVTIMQTTVADMLNKIHNHKNLFLTDIFGDKNDKTENTEQKTEQTTKSLLVVHNKNDISKKEWPEIINYRYHGLHFNRTKVSEDFEFYCTKYATRYVGVETASSCTVWSTNVPGSATKRNARLRWGLNSPGRRLSHLAKRRNTFSSSNLQANCSAAAMSVVGPNSGTNRLVIDARKSSGVLKRRSPWKKSPRKSPQKKLKTPTSSAKKSTRRVVHDESQPGTSRVVSTKRALFQSPEHNRSTTSTSSRGLFASPHKNSPAKVKNSPLKLNCDRINYASSSNSKPRRNLFISPRKQSPAKLKVSLCDKKRKRDDEDLHPSKFPRSLSFDSQQSKVSQSAGALTMQRRHSELSIGTVKTELSIHHKKKLVWTVSESLRSQQIGRNHPKFRPYAQVLCRIVKYLMPELLSNGPRLGSTTDRMLKFARQHVFSVTRGKTYEEIVQQIKETEENLKNSKQPTGYVPPEGYKSDIKNVLQDKVLNIECNQSRALKSPDTKSGIRDENNKARIKRQILFDDVDTTKVAGMNR